ncbi:hypothetical protein EV359DRAFT_65789 [Lentinula novae-zelandiae]|nr:hypothetical protein EV359DRAFT_65789 [Lentinula novae-zelandiae]
MYLRKHKGLYMQHSNFEPPPQNNESSSRKRWRSKSPNTQTNTSSAGPSKKSHRSHKATPKPTGKEKRKSDMYHIESDDIPDDARGLKPAFEIHIRILWNSLSESVTPETPSNIDIGNFMKQFSSHKQVDEVLNQPKVSLSCESLKSMVSLQKTCQLDPVASAVAQKALLFQALSLDYRMEAISTGNYVYSHLRKLILKESREKGRLASDAVKRLMKSRIKYAQDSGFNNQIKSLIAEPERNSEDEDADDGLLHILVKNLCIVELSGSKQHSYKKKTQKPHPDNKKSIFRKIPKNCALDWFQPAQFNSLPAQIQKRYVDAHIALPPFEKQKKLKVAEWGLLLEDSFMKKYENEVWKLYKFPTKEELEAMENGQSDSDMSLDNDDAMDEDGDEGEAV